MTIVTGSSINEGINIIGLGGFSISAVAIFHIMLGVAAIMAIKGFARKRMQPKKPFYDQEILDDDAPFFHKAYEGRLSYYLNNWRGVA